MKLRYEAGRCIFEFDKSFANAPLTTHCLAVEVLVLTGCRLKRLLAQSDQFFTTATIFAFVGTPSTLQSWVSCFVDDMGNTSNAGVKGISFPTPGAP